MDWGRAEAEYRRRREQRAFWLQQAFADMKVSMNFRNMKEPDGSNRYHFKLSDPWLMIIRTAINKNIREGKLSSKEASANWKFIVEQRRQGMLEVVQQVFPRAAWRQSYIIEFEGPERPEYKELRRVVEYVEMGD